MGQCVSYEVTQALNGGGEAVLNHKAQVNNKNDPRSRSFFPRRFTGKGGSASSNNNARLSRKRPKLVIITTQEDGAVETEAPLTGKTAAETPASEMPSPLNVCIDVLDETPEDEVEQEQDEHKHAKEQHDDSGDNDGGSDNGMASMGGSDSKGSKGEGDDDGCSSKGQGGSKITEISTKADDDDDDGEEEDELPTASKGGSGLSLVHFFQSLRHTEALEPVILEEIDPDAPSDEEDERIAQERALARKLPPSSTSAKPKGVGSPPRPQDRIKMQHHRITRPNSIVNRDVPQDNAAPGSVSSHHLSQFRKLKVQVKLAARQERKKARIAKLEDRYQDVRGYNTLWQDFEEIRGRAETTVPPDAAPTLKRSNSFDLHNTGTWFFDFQSFDEEDASCIDYSDFDDDMSQSSLSLHSTMSMESQRRYFKEKREGRRSRRRTNSDTNLTLMNQIISTKKRKPAVDCSVPMDPKYSPNHATASAPPSILRGTEKRNGNDDAETSGVSEFGTPQSRGPVAPQVNAFSIATGQPEYHVYKRPGEKPVAHDSDTPKAKSRRKNASYVQDEEVDMNNDYQVVRRRRVASSSDLSFLRDERSVAESLGIELPPSPEKRDFDYSSFAIEVVTTDRPDVRVMRMSPKQNTNRKEQVVAGNAARSLEESTSSSSGTLTSIRESMKRRLQRDATKRDEKYKTTPTKPTIDSMSTEDFLHFSDSHALVNVANGYGHEILIDSASSDEKENDVSGRFVDVIANDVTKEIDVLLAKYRTDNEEEVIDEVVPPEADGADEASEVTCDKDPVNSDKD